jgi:pyroglutamyl-peptidase
MPNSARPTVLITGFGPFPGIERNVTGLLVPRLAARARRRFPHLRVATAILPTEWAAAPAALARHLARAEPCLALHFGVSSGARGFVIETTGRNACRPAADAAGLLPASAWVAEGGPAQRRVSLPVEVIVARLADAGHTVATSDDAGGYLCNAVLYHSLGGAGGAAGPRRSGFVHIPADVGAAGGAMSLADAVAGGLEILAACLDTD